LVIYIFIVTEYEWGIFSVIIRMLLFNIVLLIM